jgi:PKD repeat protein
VRKKFLKPAFFPTTLPPSLWGKICLMKMVRNLLLLLVLLPAFSLSAQSGGNENQATLGGCTADFTWVDSAGYVFFISSSSLGNGGNYFWTFGDSNFSNQQYPANQYAAPGVYQVCLIVTDSMQNFCDSTCHSVTATSIASAINENTTAISALSLSPNPADASATFTFLMAVPGNVNIAVYDIYGREVLTQLTQQFSSGKQQVIIPTENFAAGTYIVQINTSGQSVQSRLTITHQ